MWRCIVMALALLLANTTAAAADTGTEMIITAKVWGWYQEYLQLMGASGRGAFAVTPDGTGSYAVYCEDIICVGGATYKQSALRNCRDISGQECIVFAYGDSILVAYKVLPPERSAAPATKPVPKVEEPPFESPLSDGTIVLSWRVTDALEDYLAYADSRASLAYFYVSQNGRAFGAYGCIINGSSASDLPPCPSATGWTNDHPDSHKARSKALDACTNGGGSGCVQLFSGGTRKAAYKLREPDPAAKLPAISAPTPVAAKVEEPPFESPLADGTIVLSHKVTAALREYLDYIDPAASIAYFHVSPNGRQFSAYGCIGNGPTNGVLPVCPATTGWTTDHLDSQKARKLAIQACQATGAGECILLYSGSSKKASYKLLD